VVAVPNLPKRFWSRLRAAVKNRTEAQSRDFARSFTVFCFIIGGVNILSNETSALKTVTILIAVFVISQVVSFIVLQNTKPSEPV